MDILFELLIDVYLDLALIFVPKEKLKKWQVITLKTLCVLFYFVIVAVVAIGIWLIDSGKKSLGATIIAIITAVVLAQVVLFVVILIKKNKKAKQLKKETETTQE